MPRERLRRTLDELHQELENAEEIDAEARAQLASAATEIRELLDRNEPADSEEPASSPLHEALEDAARRFKITHPNLFAVLRRTIDTLAQSGI